MATNESQAREQQSGSAEFKRQPIPSGVGMVALIILDGFGLRENTLGNAVEAAKKPVFDALWREYPHTTLQASEEAVGLPEGQFGNSEVGHSNIGAGRILYQELTRINVAIKNGDFYENEVLKGAMEHARDSKTALHLCGLVSDGGVHSHIDHLIALLHMAAKLGLKDVFVHAFMDGRDTAPTGGENYLAQVLSAMKTENVGKVATVQGRYYSMDRDKRWERIEKSYRSMVYGDGNKATDPIEALRESYAKDVTDEFIIPTVIVDEAGQPVGQVKDNDSIIMFNFRPDRAIELSQVFTNDDFSGFDRGPKFPHVKYVCMTKYSDTVVADIAYKPTSLANTLGEVLAANGLTQLRAAETEKYPHVTFFLSGGREAPFPGEERILIPSPKVATYDLQPEMSAYPLAEAVAAKVETGDIDVLVLNFANPDMVGHTGSIPAAIAAVEAVDECLGKVMKAIQSRNGIALVTADHGNADMMLMPDGSGPCTTHTTSLVPLIVTKPGVNLSHGVLADLAPTILALLGVSQPQEMTGKPLIEK